jgi:hypothetical protein
MSHAEGVINAGMAKGKQEADFTILKLAIQIN